MPLAPDLAMMLEHLTPGQRLLGVDLGSKTIGIALSDVGRSIATPMQTLRRRKFSEDIVLIAAIIAEQNVGGIIVGLPVNMNATEGPRAQSARAFAKNLNKHLKLPVALWDERLSTAAAERMLIDADASRARRAELIDKIAAAYILQGALDRMAHK